ncbi:hypothetical protein PoB_000073100 [Plakobranchus ocellatus]|uniref:Uncharacterized protein n=1 Tax=Plakobranchus ocellatus TaxID=259542 RepID=A0AAV3WUZ5_9GAST|nr:hypothetical protein PoB_000073100 [Plakobranchus ocellatus]
MRQKALEKYTRSCTKCVDPEYAKGARGRHAAKRASCSGGQSTQRSAQWALLKVLKARQDEMDAYQTDLECILNGFSFLDST